MKLLQLKPIIVFTLLFIPLVACKSFITLLFESNPKSNNFATNFDDYLKIINNILETKDLDVIVFPEYGLTGILNSNEDIKKFAIDVERDSLEQLKRLAKENNIYIIINLIEKYHNSSYNTNLVIDNKGSFNTRKFRKTNLNEHERKMKLLPGNNSDSRIMSTKEFGNFIIITGNDLKLGLSQNELSQIKNSTESFTIICPSALESHYPFQMASSFYYNFAKSNGINLLVSQLKPPGIQETGVYTIFGNEECKYKRHEDTISTFIYEVTINENQENSCLNFELPNEIQRLPLNHKPTVKEHKFIDSSLENNYSSIDLSNFKFYNYTCKSNFCCSVILKIKNLDIHKPFKLVLEEKNDFLICSLLACNDSENCSKPTTTLTVFDYIEIEIFLQNIAEGYFLQPVCLNENLEPISNINYCQKSLQNARLIAFDQSNVIAIGIKGIKSKNNIVTDKDDQSQSSPGDCSINDTKTNAGYKTMKISWKLVLILYFKNKILIFFY